MNDEREQPTDHDLRVLFRIGCTPTYIAQLTGLPLPRILKVLDDVASMSDIEPGPIPPKQKNDYRATHKKTPPELPGGEAEVA